MGGELRSNTLVLFFKKKLLNAYHLALFDPGATLCFPQETRLASVGDKTSETRSIILLT